ncbi:MAG: SiaB family protein kinase [Bacteroidales bacterium]|nr:SiaB family protein kinase [Bacteroidales bacterium]
MKGKEDFINYTGPFTYETIDRVLDELKDADWYNALSQVARKRIYAILVECMENIVKHSVDARTGRDRFKSFIRVSEKEGNIVISAGNPVYPERAEELAVMIEMLNELDQETLSSLCRDKINGKTVPGRNSAGLGFITMRLRSGTRIDYSFTRIDEGLSFFSMQIKVNKNVMKKLFIEPTASSPEVMLDPDQKMFTLSGESRPPDVAAFYGEIIAWFDEYSSHLLSTVQEGEPVVINLDFVYFNSASAKYILDLCKMIAAVRSKGAEIIINWHYESDDTDMLEAGKEMSKIAKIPFELTKK